jgi:hypothetical protein
MAELKALVERTNAENKGLWSDYGTSLPDYENKLAEILGTQKGAYAELANALGKYKASEGLFAGDPQLAAHDPESRLASQLALSKLGALTSPQETAQEKLIRELARRQMENELRANRDATAASLKARGVYGGGAELTSALAAQQEAASRRSLADMQANAQASQRALQALGQYNQSAQSMSAADDALSKFNSALLAQNKQARAQARQADNSAQGNRAATLNNAATSVNQMATQNADKSQQAKQSVVAGKTGVNSNALNQFSGLTQMEMQAEATKQAQAIAEQKPKGLFGGILNLGW